MRIPQPILAAILSYVREHPGCSQDEAAEAVCKQFDIEWLTYRESKARWKALSPTERRRQYREAQDWTSVVWDSPGYQVLLCVIELRDRGRIVWLGTPGSGAICLPSHLKAQERLTPEQQLRAAIVRKRMRNEAQSKQSAGAAA